MDDTMCLDKHQKLSLAEKPEQPELLSPLKLVSAEYALCPQCDLMVKLPELQPDMKATCPRCRHTLTVHWNEPLKQPMFCAISALIMLWLANIFPFVNMRISGIFNQITISQIPQALGNDNYTSIATLFVVLVQIVPALCMSAIILLYINFPLPTMLKVGMARMIFWAKTWCMAEIFLAGVFVSFVKLMAYGDIGLGLSFLPYCLFCLFQLRAFQCTDRYRLWQSIERMPKLHQEPKVGISGLQQDLRQCGCCMAILPAEERTCPRCNKVGYVRRRYSIQLTMALLITSIMLYIPANILPIMITEALGSKIASTIMSGVILLWDSGSYPVAMVIFVASIMVPTLKILAMLWLCYDASRIKAGNYRDRERMHFVYDMVEFVGRWSMIDIFVIAVLSTLVRIGRFMSVYPDIGALLFAMVVIFTMIAAMMFDPRLVWDRYNRLNEKEPDSAA